MKESTKWKIVVATFLGFSTAAASAENFAGKQFSLGAVVSAGSLLECEAPDAPSMKRFSPRSFAWMKSQGLAEESTVTGTPSYTARITTKDSSGQRVLVVGCWVTTEIVKETVDGKVVVFAKGAFKLNDAIRSSPLAEFVVCKKKKPGPPLYGQGDFRVVHEMDAVGCKPDNWQERIAPLAKAEQQTALFALHESLDKKGYVRTVGW